MCEKLILTSDRFDLTDPLRSPRHSGQDHLHHLAGLAPTAIASEAIVGRPMGNRKDLIILHIVRILTSASSAASDGVGRMAGFREKKRKI